MRCWKSTCCDLPIVRRQRNCNGPTTKKHLHKIIPRNLACNVSDGCDTSYHKGRTFCTSREWQLLGTGSALGDGKFRFTLAIPKVLRVDHSPFDGFLEHITLKIYGLGNRRKLPIRVSDHKRPDNLSTRPAQIQIRQDQST